MGPIYEPKGKAKEYADFALNIYNGCPHKCPYCFSPLVLRKDRKEFHLNAEPRENIVEKTKNQLESWREQGIMGRTIELCFTCDPFPYGYDHTPTFEIIKAIKESGNNVKILTKNFRIEGKKPGGFGRLLDLLDKNDWFGCSFDGTKEIYQDVMNCRVELASTMHYMHQKTNTWISFEPVVDDKEVLDAMRLLSKDVDNYKIGKLNYQKSDIDWKEFGRKAEELCKEIGIDYYIKESLRKEMGQEMLRRS